MEILFSMIMEKVYGWLVIWLCMIGIIQLHIIQRMLSKIGKVVSEYNITWEEIEEEAREIDANK